ncbi:peptide deformylase-like protein [Gluconacetobacter liquefaciens]|uniref:Peptide deformylase-like n=1 Tax=Gluconacetobacter liquefaciens TaxID=89584 RepID=A0A370G952_GLULI|nr:peptide deformylase [Gluconacetobacter liquefaciens]MBB2184921.1 peptide deformylase [Gluconacetobacter liquefaciens]RDI40345.1 peptide deformylase [Gluconacetobacter liquefaciens]GBR02617.1 N-formylmethionylaminoacyl-tRNA deformylase [Gluconacetobacter liquefaciens NRIC 0522]GEB38202.1 peptide deformylase-like protein [Gluconacetobacter liquefaciens]
MPARPIVMFPDQRLRTAAEPVTQFDAALRTLAADLFDTMQAAPGIGITAPHIGMALRVVVLDLRDTSGARTYINPEIIWASDETIQHEEGSVSMPGVTEQIERPAKVRVQYQDLDGQNQIEESDGLRAICHQHEIDQLNGIFWIQRLSALRRTRLVARYEKSRRANSR